MEISTDTLPLDMGKTAVNRLTNLYVKIITKKLGTKPVISYPKTGSIIKTLLKSCSEIQASALIMAHCNFNSTKNEWLSSQLKLKIYPIEMLLANVNIYISYLIFERNVEYDDVDNLKERVYKYIDTLQI